MQLLHCSTHTMSITLIPHLTQSIKKCCTQAVLADAAIADDTHQNVNRVC